MDRLAEWIKIQVETHMDMYGATEEDVREAMANYLEDDDDRFLDAVCDYLEEKGYTLKED